MILTVSLLILGVAWGPLLCWGTPSRPWAFDLVSQFVAKAGVVGLGLGAAGMLWKGTRLVGVAGVVGGAISLGVGVWQANPAWLGAMEAEGEGTRLRVAFYNAHAGLGGPDERFFEWLEGVDADLVALVEVPNGFIDREAWVRERYPYRVEPQPRLSWRVVLLSRLPMRPVRIVAPEPKYRQSFAAHRTSVVTLPDGGTMLFSAMHPPSPRSDRTWRLGLEDARRDGPILGAAAERYGEAMIVAGDFNSTPTGRVHEIFKRESGLSVRSPLLVGTWPASLPGPLRIPIDAVWVSDGVRVLGIETGPKCASDHRPIVADVWVPLGVEGAQRRPREESPATGPRQNRTETQ